MTKDAYFFLLFFSYLFLHVSVYFGICATIRTHQEIQFLPYAGLLLYYIILYYIKIFFFHF